MYSCIIGTLLNLMIPIQERIYSSRLDVLDMAIVSGEYIQNGIIPGRNRQIRKAYYVIAVRDISREVLPLTRVLRYSPLSIIVLEPYIMQKKQDSNSLNWAGEVTNVTNDGVAAGMDLNYFTFDVNMIGVSNLAGGEDACMVRFVE